MPPKREPQPDPMEESRRQHFARTAAPLMGGVVTAAGPVPIQGRWYQAVTVTCPDGHTRTAVVYQDQEGNGPGYLEVLDLGETRVARTTEAADRPAEARP